MGLLIYEVADPETAFSIGNDFSKPVEHAFDGVAGGVIIRRYFIRNDDPAFTYSNIEVFPVHQSGRNIIDGTDGFSWKLIAGDQEPLEAQWALVSPGNTIDIPDISDTSTYEPFWVRIEVPRGASVSSYEGLKLRVSATESV